MALNNIIAIKSIMSIKLQHVKPCTQSKYFLTILLTIILITNIRKLQLWKWWWPSSDLMSSNVVRKAQAPFPQQKTNEDSQAGVDKIFILLNDS